MEDDFGLILVLRVSQLYHCKKKCAIRKFPVTTESILSCPKPLEQPIKRGTWDQPGKSCNQRLLTPTTFPTNPWAAIAKGNDVALSRNKLGCETHHGGENESDCWAQTNAVLHTRRNSEVDKHLVEEAQQEPQQFQVAAR